MCAQFKKNYTSNRSASFIRILLFGLVFVVLTVSLFHLIDEIYSSPAVRKEGFNNSVDLVGAHGLEEVDHEYFQLGYSEEHEQALWVSYILTESLLRKPNVPRTDYFEEDPKVLTKSAHYRDYSHSGYSRGHLVPAADMAFSIEAMERTFYMSNITPQLSSFNGGIWRELEELCRDWAMIYEQLYIVSGPLFLETGNRTIGKTSEVRVPSHFYKVVMTGDWDAIAFVVPHRLCTEPVMDFAVSVDSVEHLTGFEFFNNLLDNEIEWVAKAEFDTGLWRVDVTRYQNRVKNWNKR